MIFRHFYSTFPQCNEIAACAMGVIWISCLRSRKDTIAPQRETTIVSARNANRVGHVYRHSHTRVSNLIFQCRLMHMSYVCLRKKVIFFLRERLCAQRYIALISNFSYFYFQLLETERLLLFDFRLLNRCLIYMYIFLTVIKFSLIKMVLSRCNGFYRKMDEPASI